MDFQKIYVINLKSQIDRRESVKRELESAGWYNHEFIEAVDGKSLPSTDVLIEDGVLSKTFIDPNGLLTKNIIACSLSHMKAYEKFLQDGHESCLIIEDDIRINTLFLKKKITGRLHEISFEKSGVDFDIFMWGLVGENIPHYDEGFNGKFKHIAEYKKYSPDYAAHAYQITREGAQKLITNNTPVRFAADVNLETSDCNIYCTPWSLIDQHSGILSRFATDNLEQSFIKLINKNEFASDTSSEIKSKGSLCGTPMYDIYFSPDRNIRYEKKKYSCNISKDINVKSIKFETFTDLDGTINRNWCHIGL
jgi:glycosyl transferase family 25|tara:strand:+ start:257 stop:1180 length:924 start_codon:yes stop_codon:yes gene_type:complete